MTKSLRTTESTANANLREVIQSLQVNACDFVLNTGALAIKSATSAVAITANTIYAMIDGVLVSKAASDMAALSGTVTNAKYNVFVFTMNASGTLKTTMGTEGATLGAVVFPTIPDDEVVIGFVLVHPTGTGNFVGGSTTLDSATVTPNAVYINTPYPFNPNALAL